MSLGVLQSRAHEAWTLASCGWHGVGNDATYNPTLCFETFPFPECTAGYSEKIAALARELDDLRNQWLNPPEWTKTEVLEFPGSVDGPWARYIDPATVRPISSSGRPHPSPSPEEEGTVGIGTVRWPRIVPKDPDCAGSLRNRTLTHLYNQRPTWLLQVHKKLDEAVFAAYGWEPVRSDEELLERLLQLNLERSQRDAKCKR
jgi:hypothetical protein